MEALEELNLGCLLGLLLTREYPHWAVQWWDLGYFPFLSCCPFLRLILQLPPPNTSSN